MPMAQPMPEDRFWSIIGQAAGPGGDEAAQAEALGAALRRLPPDDIVAFQAALVRQVAGAYRWDLWGAAYVIHGGAGDDAFDYFRHWLVAQGQAVFGRVLADPDGLAELLPPDRSAPLMAEEIGHVAMTVWAAITGRRPAEILARIDPAWLRLPPAPAGTPFAEDPDDLARRYPRLWARFGETPLG